MHVATTAAHPAAAAAATEKTSVAPDARAHPSRVVVLSGVYAVTLAGLVVLRAVVDSLGFVSMGWLFVLALLPILPWLIPALAPVVARIAPNVQSLKLPGGFEIALRDAAHTAPTLGAVENVLTQDLPAPFSISEAMTVASGVQALRATGSPTAVVDLGAGTKWRLPNLYYLAWLIAHEPVLHWLVFTETEQTVSGVFVGVAHAADVCHRIEGAYPEYAQVAPQLAAGTASVAEPTRSDGLVAQFHQIRNGVAPPGQDAAPTLAWVDAPMLRSVVGPDLGTTAVPWGTALDRAGLQRLAQSPVPYVAATTTDGRLRGLLDQREVLVEFTRRALEGAQSS